MTTDQIDELKVHSFVGNKEVFCYKVRNESGKYLISGATHGKPVNVGDVFKGIPFNKIDNVLFLINKIEYRDHKGETKRLGFDSECEIIEAQL